MGVSSHGDVPEPRFTSVHAVIGFDERPILHCIHYAVKKGRVSRVTLYKPVATDEYAERRSKLAIDMIDAFVKNMGGDVSVKEIPSLSLPHAIPVMRARIEEDLRDPETLVIACLSSGMRLLVIALYTALIAQHPRLHNRIYIYIEPEGKPEEGFAIRLSDITRLIIPFVAPNRSTLETAVIELLLERGEASFSEIYQAVGKKLGRVARSTLYRALKKLVDEDLLSKDERGVYKLKLHVEKLRA